MIKASKVLTDYIEAQENMGEFSDRAKIAKSVIYSVLRGETPSTDTVQKLLNVSGFDYEKAFEVK